MTAGLLMLQLLVCQELLQSESSVDDSTIDYRDVTYASVTVRNVSGRALHVLPPLPEVSLKLELACQDRHAFIFQYMGWGHGGLRLPDGETFTTTLPIVPALHMRSWDKPANVAIKLMASPLHSVFEDGHVILDQWVRLPSHRVQLTDTGSAFPKLDDIYEFNPSARVGLYPTEHGIHPNVPRSPSTGDPLHRFAPVNADYFDIPLRIRYDDERELDKLRVRVDRKSNLHRVISIVAIAQRWVATQDDDARTLLESQMLQHASEGDAAEKDFLQNRVRTLIENKSMERQ